MGTQVKFGLSKLDEHAEAVLDAAIRSGGHAHIHGGHGQLVWGGVVHERVRETNGAAVLEARLPLVQGDALLEDFLFLLVPFAGDLEETLAAGSSLANDVAELFGSDAFVLREFLVFLAASHVLHIVSVNIADDILQRNHARRLSDHNSFAGRAAVLVAEGSRDTPTAEGMAAAQTPRVNLHLEADAAGQLVAKLITNSLLSCTGSWRSAFALTTVVVVAVLFLQGQPLGAAPANDGR